jgi:hypothetical protein
VILEGREKRGKVRNEKTNETSQGYRDVTSGYEWGERSSHASIAQGKKEGKIQSESRNEIVQNKEEKGNQGARRKKTIKKEKSLGVDYDVSRIVL